MDQDRGGGQVWQYQCMLYHIHLPGPYLPAQINSAIARAGSSLPIAAAAAYPGARGQTSLYPKETSSLQNFPVGYSVAHDGAIALPYKNLVRTGLSITLFFACLFLRRIESPKKL